jgi:hypothetical protein
MTMLTKRVAGIGRAVMPTLIGTIVAGLLAPGCGADEGPELCSLPFESGRCEAAIRVYASVDGKCVERTWGGCEGNDNRFFLLEECLSVCEGRPERNSCPDGREPASICVACGEAGGCAEQAVVCAKPCSSSSDCTPDLTCTDGWCQRGRCI